MKVISWYKWTCLKWPSFRVKQLVFLVQLVSYPGLWYGFGSTVEPEFKTSVTSSLISIDHCWLSKWGLVQTGLTVSSQCKIHIKMMCYAVVLWHSNVWNWTPLATVLGTKDEDVYFILFQISSEPWETYLGWWGIKMIWLRDVVDFRYLVGFYRMRGLWRALNLYKYYLLWSGTTKTDFVLHVSHMRHHGDPNCDGAWPVTTGHHSNTGCHGGMCCV